MSDPILIAAALIENDRGEILLVRKRGTKAFMQAGGKIESGESRFEALARELDEELGLEVERSDAQFLGVFTCDAANEPNHLIEAHIFRVRCERRHIVVAAELAKAIWVTADEADNLDLAPLTRDHILPIVRARATAVEPDLAHRSYRGARQRAA